MVRVQIYYWYKYKWAGNNMNTSGISARTTCLVSAVLLGALFALLPTASSATIYIYTAGSASDTVGDFSFTTSLSSAQVSNLPAGTDITGTVTPFTFPVLASSGFQQDNAGFLLGGPFGSSYFNVISGPTVQIGTNAAGQITSWNISESIFASYPAVPGEDPNDFFNTYLVSTTNTGNTVSQIVDHNAGLGPNPSGVGLGSFSAVITPTVPEPSTWAMLLIGFAGIGAMACRRRNRVAA
jgi:hypothetical protein